ncbi:MAG: FtsH protease activity modulator HflK [Endozoicomonadaceae bacterium]|nr:FtsH protease activity modulator HflK [Endozoicomonadaceae bacterium]
MPWNEPGGDNKDPWGSRNRKKGSKGPPDLDEAFKKLQKLLSGMLGGKGTKSPGGYGNKTKPESSFSVFLWLILFVAIVVYAYKAIYIVDEKERAVILRFGKYVETVSPGLHVYFPPIEKRYQAQVTNYRVYRLNQEMLTQDENIVQIALSVQYNISDFKAYELNVANPTLSLEEATQSALRHAVGSSTMHGVLTEGREVLADEVKRRLQQYLDNYGTGLSISRVNVESAQPPKQVQMAFDDVIKAREDEERLKNNAQAYSNQIIPEARGQAQRLIEEANAYKEKVVALAEGESARFLNIYNAYRQAPDVTRERLYLDMMQNILSNSTKVLLDRNSRGNIFYLPLDKLMQRKSADSSESSDELSTEEKSTLANKAMSSMQRKNQNNSVIRRSNQ